MVVFPFSSIFPRLILFPHSSILQPFFFFFFFLLFSLLPQYARRAKLYTNVHAKAGKQEVAMDKGAGKGLAAKGGSSSLSLSAAMGAGGDKSGGDRGEGEEKGVASKINQQQNARRKSLKRL